MLKVMFVYFTKLYLYITCTTSVPPTFKNGSYHVVCIIHKKNHALIDLCKEIFGLMRNIVIECKGYNVLKFHNIRI